MIATIPIFSPHRIVINPSTNKVYVVAGGDVAVIDGATNSFIAWIPVGTGPSPIALNPVTNKIYVANIGSNNVTVIDGATNSTATVAVDLAPNGIAVNPVTNKIYVSNYHGHTITVIDGATNSTTTVAVENYPGEVIVNPATNKIYVAGTHTNHVMVIDGATNSVSTVMVGATPHMIVVNPVTNKVYVSNSQSGGYIRHITVIDGATNATSTIPIIAGFIAINPVTNKLYAVTDGNTVTAIDGTTHSIITTVPVGDSPHSIAVNPVTNKMYVANFVGNSVTVIDGATNSTTTITVGRTPISVKVNPVTNKIYVANYWGYSVSVIGQINTDTTPPALTMPNLVDSYTVGSAAVLTFSATDTQSQIASISATLNGNPVSSGGMVVLNQLGLNTFTLTATDTAGNTATQTDEFVVSYGFGGFLPPLTADSRTAFRLGSVIPVKFNLYDVNGAPISTAVVHLSLQKFSGDNPVGDATDATSVGNADTGNLFRYSDGHYIYNLSTRPLTAGTWSIQVMLDDGTIQTIMIGLTSK